MKRTMKQAMMDKMATHYFNKRGMSVAEAKAMSAAELQATGLPQVIRNHVSTMDEHTNQFSVARTIAALGTESTATHSPAVVYTPEQEVIAEKQVITQVVEEYIAPVEPVEPVVEVVAETVVEKAEEVAPMAAPAGAPGPVASAYTEEDLRRIIESVEQSSNSNTLMKKVKAAMDKSYTYDVNMLTSLCKEYAAKAKK